MPGPANKEEEAAPKHLAALTPAIQQPAFPGWSPPSAKNRKSTPRRKRRRLSRSNTQQPLPGLGLYPQAIMPLAKRKTPKPRMPYPYPRRRRPQTAGGLQQGIPGLETNPQSAKIRQLEQEKETARKRQMRYIRPWTRRLILRRDNYMCVYCYADLRKVPIEIDHLVPVSRQGDNRIGNLQSTCRTCNRRKRHYSDGAPLREALARRQRQAAAAKQLNLFHDIGEPYQPAV